LLFLVISCYFLLFLVIVSAATVFAARHSLRNVVRSFCGVSTFGVARDDPKSFITVAMKNAARAAKSVAIRRD
jgi:hypothetical protein